MATYTTEYGPIQHQDTCKDDYANLVTYDQPLGGVVTLQRPAMRSLQIAEERYARKTWRPGFPKKVTQKLDPEVWGRDGRDHPNPNFQATGKRTFRPIVILAGSKRSCSTQAALYARDSRRYAHPDSGLHTHGLAIDVHTGYLSTLVRTILKNAGWKQSRPDDEPWHHSYYLQA